MRIGGLAVARHTCGTSTRRGSKVTLTCSKRERANHSRRASRQVKGLLIYLSLPYAKIKNTGPARASQPAEGVTTAHLSFCVSTYCAQRKASESTSLFARTGCIVLPARAYVPYYNWAIVYIALRYGAPRSAQPLSETESVGAQLELTLWNIFLPINVSFAPLARNEPASPVL